MAASEWDLSSLPDLAKWLFDGLYAAHNGKTYGERKYALLPVELNDIDYPFLQIVRQVRTFDRKSLPQLSEANEAAIGRWRPSYGVKPLLDMIGLVQELGSRSFSRHLSDLTLPSTLNRLPDTDRDLVFGALTEALIPQSDFYFDGPLYPAFLKLTTPPASLQAPVLARALKALIEKTPKEWRGILKACRTHFEASAGPAQSQLGTIFFTVEAKLTREYFQDLFKHGGEANFLPEDTWLIEWLFAAGDPQRPSQTPLRFVSSSRDEYWIGFASPQRSDLPLNKADMGHLIVQAFDAVLTRQSGLDSITSFARKKQEPRVQAMSGEDAEQRPLGIDVLRSKLRSRSGG